MPCNTALAKGQTISERAEEIRAAVAALEKALIAKQAKVIVGPQGAVAFAGNWDRKRITDACAYRRIMATGSALARIEIAKAEQLAGRSVNRQVIGQGAHSHDGGRTWHDHKG